MAWILICQKITRHMVRMFASPGVLTWHKRERDRSSFQTMGLGNKCDPNYLRNDELDTCEWFHALKFVRALSSPWTESGSYIDTLHVVMACDPIHISLDLDCEIGTDAMRRRAGNTADIFKKLGRSPTALFGRIRLDGGDRPGFTLGSQVFRETMAPARHTLQVFPTGPVCKARKHMLLTHHPGRALRTLSLSVPNPRDRELLPRLSSTRCD